MHKVSAIIILSILTITHPTTSLEVDIICGDGLVSDNFEYYNCSIPELTSKTSKVTVTSIDTISQTESTKEVDFLFIGNEFYPEYFPEELSNVIQGATGLFYRSTPLKYIKRSDFTALAPRLNALGLDNNEIEEIPFDTFHDLVGLILLNLRYNKLKALEPKLLLNSIKLKIFSAKFNKIEKIDENFLKNSKNLEIFSISNNKLVEVPENLFSTNDNLWAVNFTANSIENIPIDFKSFTSLAVVDIRENIGTCDGIFMKEGVVEKFKKEKIENIVKNIEEFQEIVEQRCRKTDRVLKLFDSVFEDLLF
jgi:hypothetical protein